MKKLQEVVGNTLEQIGRDNDFLNRAQKAQHLRETVNKWDCIKLKSCAANSRQTQETAHKMGENLCKLFIQ
jgi:hypothetical protein